MVDKILTTFVTFLFCSAYKYKNTQHMKYQIYNKTTNETIDYAECQYVKFEGMYGYLFIDTDHRVKFIWNDENGIYMDFPQNLEVRIKTI